MSETPSTDGERDEGNGRVPTPVVIVGAIVAALALIGIVGIIVALLVPGAGVVFGAMRDVAIIVMALSFLLDALALAILVYQASVLVNLVKNEVGPILESAQETAGTVSGTSEFVGRHLVAPLIKASGFVAGLARLLAGIFDIMRRLLRERPSGSQEN